MVGETTTQPGTGPGRGFIAEETIVTTIPSSGLLAGHRSLWRPVIAGSVFVLSMFILSWYLMLGCHVGVDGYGVVALNLGAAIWLWVTACVAFYFGGMIAGGSSPVGVMDSRLGYVRGAVLWGLTVLLGLIIYTFVTRGGNALIDLSLPQTANAESMTTAQPHAHLGIYWSVFITLGLSLIFSLIGTVSGSAVRTNRE